MKFRRAGPIGVGEWPQLPRPQRRSSWALFRAERGPQQVRKTGPQSWPRGLADLRPGLRAMLSDKALDPLPALSDMARTDPVWTDLVVRCRYPVGVYPKWTARSARRLKTSADLAAPDWTVSEAVGLPLSNGQSATEAQDATARTQRHTMGVARVSHAPVWPARWQDHR